MDELWSFVRSRANKQWLWLAFDKESRQVIAFYVGDRSRESARKLWRRIPRAYRERATFYSDDWEAYKGVIPSERHRACGKESGPPKEVLGIKKEHVNLSDEARYYKTEKVDVLIPPRAVLVEKGAASTST